MANRRRRPADTLDEPAGPGPMARVVTEALDRVATPDARDSVLFLALSESGLGVIPNEPALFRRFALGPLRRAMSLSLSDDISDAVLADLTPIIERAASTITSALRGLRVGDADPAVIVGAIDAAVAERWLVGAPPGAHVRVCADVFELVTAVDAFRRHDLAIIIDGSMSSARAAALKTLGRIAPPQARVLLIGWGSAADGLPEHWLRLEANASRERVLSAAFPPDDVADARPSTVPDGPAKVLVIEHDANLRAAIASHLRGAGMEVRTVPDAYLGLEMAAEERPQVIVVDGALPEADGDNFCGLVARILGPEPPGVVVLLDDRPRPIKGASEVLVKGADNARLIEVVEACRR